MQAEIRAGEMYNAEKFEKEERGQVQNPGHIRDDQKIIPILVKVTVQIESILTLCGDGRTCGISKCLIQESKAKVKMVKSYTGVRKEPEKVLPQVLVGEVMSRQITTFRSEQIIGEVTRTLMDKSISGGPVVDQEGKLIGMISEGDCLKQMVRGKYMNSIHDDGIVGDHMSTAVHTVAPDENVLDVARKFLDLKVRRFPVLENGKLIGQISQRDVMRALDKLQHRTL